MSREKVVEMIPALRAFARILCHSSDDADDLVQETLTKAIANLDKFEAGTRLKSWLFTIMRNTFNTNYKKSMRERPGMPPELFEQQAVAPGQEWSARTQEVKAALMRLPEAQREILVVIVLAGESYESAAEMLGCAMGTVKSRLFRARRRLLQELGEAEDEE